MSSHFQESPAWNYFDFQFEDMGYTSICINTKKSLICQTIDYLQMSMNIRNCTCVDPLLKHMSSPLKYLLVVFIICDCTLYTCIFNKIKVYWNVWDFDYFHSSCCIDTGFYILLKIQIFIILVFVSFPWHSMRLYQHSDSWQFLNN
jgi:hypothetical protein